MKKPGELRQYLIACIPVLQKGPEQLQIYIDTGNLQARLETGLNFEYQYTLNIILTDLALAPDAVMVPLLAWLKHNQPDLPPDAVRFEADVIDHKKVDLSITVQLTERVLVTTDGDGNHQTVHAPEPVPEYNLPEPEAFENLFANGEPL